MENSTVAGTHMSLDLFRKALDLTAKLEEMAWRAGLPPCILLSGGECSENPDLIAFIEEVYRRNYLPILITNGMWLDNPELKASILRPEWANLLIQVTNDPKFYPSKPAHIPGDDRIAFIPSLTNLIPLGRFKKGHGKGLPLKGAPSSFNFRYLVRGHGDVRIAIQILRTNAMLGRFGHCTPSITHEGVLTAGETNSCFPVGTVDSSVDAINKAVFNMHCNKCGLVDNLTHEQKYAIGESLISPR